MDSLLIKIAFLVISLTLHTVTSHTAEHQTLTLNLAQRTLFSHPNATSLIKATRIYSSQLDHGALHSFFAVSPNKRAILLTETLKSRANICAQLSHCQETLSPDHKCTMSMNVIFYSR